MQVGRTKEIVEVTSEAPLVDTTSTQLGAVMDDRIGVNLPLNARDTYQFLQLQPGVKATGGSRLSFTEAIRLALFLSMAVAVVPTTSM